MSIADRQMRLWTGAQRIRLSGSLRAGHRPVNASLLPQMQHLDVVVDEWTAAVDVEGALAVLRARPDNVRLKEYYSLGIS